MLCQKCDLTESKLKENIKEDSIYFKDYTRLYFEVRLYFKDCTLDITKIVNSHVNCELHTNN